MKPRETAPGNSLKVKSFVYEALVSKLVRFHRGNPEATVEMVERVAHYAWRHHAGIFADGRVENVLLEFSAEVEKRVPKDKPRELFAGDGRPRLLHVASRANQTTGNTRVLAKWIERDADSDACLVLTWQDREIPPILETACRRRGIRVVQLPGSLSRLDRAGALRGLARRAERIVLHHDRDDVIPSLALAARDCPPVVYFNHSHFWFSLGDTVADLTLSTFPFFEKLTRERRFPRKTALIPGVIGNHEYEPFDKAEAKKKLGLDPGLPVLFSCGFEGYYRPAHGQDFFATLQKVMARGGPMQVLVAGVRPEADFLPSEITRHPRILLEGPVADLRPYYRAADLCLESFPHPSLGGFLEATAYGGAFPIPAFGEGENVLRVDLPPVSGSSPRAPDEKTYVAGITNRLANLEQSRLLARKLQAELQAIDQAWPATLQSIYQCADGLRHAPGPIPAASSVADLNSRLLAELHEVKLPQLIHEWFPYFSALRLVFLAVLHGLAEPTRTLKYEWGYVWKKAQRRFSTLFVF